MRVDHARLIHSRGTCKNIQNGARRLRSLLLLGKCFYEDEFRCSQDVLYTFIDTMRKILADKRLGR